MGAKRRPAQDTRAMPIRFHGGLLGLQNLAQIGHVLGEGAAAGGGGRGPRLRLFPFEALLDGHVAGALQGVQMRAEIAVGRLNQRAQLGEFDRAARRQRVQRPFADTIDYHDLYLGLNDADTPPSIKDMFTYNPDKAKQLLKDAGFPSGFKASILLSSAASADVDYYSIIKDMWSKIGIDLSLDVVDPGTFQNRQASRNYTMTNGTTAPAATFYTGVAYVGSGQIANLGNLNDPVVNQALTEIQTQVISDIPGAMKSWREKIAKYVVDQAYAIPNVIGYNYNIWWPWVRGYSGEGPVSYAQTIWMNYVWYDTAMKKSMGH